MPVADGEKTMVLLALLIILSFTFAVAYFFGRAALDGVFALVQRGEVAVRSRAVTRGIPAAVR